MALSLGLSLYEKDIPLPNMPPKAILQRAIALPCRYIEPVNLFASILLNRASTPGLRASNSATDVSKNLARKPKPPSRKRSRSTSVKVLFRRRLLDRGDATPCAGAEALGAGGVTGRAADGKAARSCRTTSTKASSRSGHEAIGFPSFGAARSLPKGAECQSHGRRIIGMTDRKR